MSTSVYLNCPNITFNRIEDITCEVSKPEKLDETTVFIVTEKDYSEEDIYKYAKVLIKAGCRDFKFCGKAKEDWHLIFDLQDLSLCPDCEDISLTCNIEDIDSIADEIDICWDNIRIYADEELFVRIRDSIRRRL